jgi:hypothetical protein
MLLKRRGMLVMDAFKACLTMDVRSVFHAMNTDFVVISRERTNLTTTHSSESLLRII